MVSLRNQRLIRNGLIRIANHFRKALKLAKNGKRVIAFHDISDAKIFREKIEWLITEYEVVSLEKLFHLPLKKKTQLAITFDDGYSCWHELVAPIFEEFNVPCVFFVCSGFVGLNSREAENFIRHNFRRKQVDLHPLTQRQLIDTANHPLFEIGSHTAHHIDLGQQANDEMLSAEIYADKRQLEDWTGTVVRWFAYPFGQPYNISPPALSFVKKIGFLAAFTLMPGYFYANNDQFLIGRDSLNITESAWLWRAWLDGSYDNLFTIKSKCFDVLYKLFHPIQPFLKI